MNNDILKDNFLKIFKISDKLIDEICIFFAPGRVNLIGEHTDYCGGNVMPFAINKGTYCVIRKNNDRIFRLFSLNFEDDGIITYPLNSSYLKDNKWTDYFLGVLQQFVINYSALETGYDILIYGDIPDSSGLSSSASLEVVLLFALISIEGHKIPQTGSDEMSNFAKLCQKAENNFVGVKSGIMDQFAVSQGKKNKAILLNCENMDFKYVDLNLDKYSIMVINSSKKRKLSESRYNERKNECMNGIEILKKHKIIKNSLNEVDIKKWNEVKDIFNNDDITSKRVYHVISENERVLNTAKALSDSDYELLFRLINESGDSLRYNYEVTGYYLDTLVDIARATDGVYASRMTGAGFGGCTINIVDSKKIDGIKKSILEKYYKETNLKPLFYIFDIENGVCKI